VNCLVLTATLALVSVPGANSARADSAFMGVDADKAFVGKPGPGPAQSRPEEALVLLRLAPKNVKRLAATEGAR
jgi:hypothetical protein